MCALHWSLLTQDDVCDDKGEDKDCEAGEGEDEHVEEAVVPLPNTVPHPGTMVVESLWRTGSEMGEENVQLSTKDISLTLRPSSPVPFNRKIHL